MTSEAATATEEAVVAEAVLAAFEAAPVIDEPEPAAESSPSAAAAQLIEDRVIVRFSRDETEPPYGVTDDERG
ncbi:hypothetical protein EDD98_7569 [Streptomyces sp. PanSC19]|uniref:hypothetical protein n=1 Tax=Streptomyces sp. PanSC19 TaxID=1520455 RepID=UPI000FAF8814|nr:hypothetical protein [Streptomyces sp. PanSC19]ROQ23619.1 hypothetical protein EDD98_7569 [Streptomyces sp. PanSC19]